MVQWNTLRIPHGLMEELEKFLELSVAKKTGFTSKTQATTTAMREFLLKYSKRFEHVNIYEDRVRILDNNIDRHGDSLRFSYAIDDELLKLDVCLDGKYVLSTTLSWDAKRIFDS